ncbi:hypothetical protein PVK06_040490 [Gossypium arboreum]|uniref:Uncharacterized protein n=1 Tax=Gossypium arboreum TaxID=29729 RepID=A0ABR0N5P7_GOSAR|nr:hypothetical protein PVK06_040490 [Gossypium arboreum]
MDERERNEALETKLRRTTKEHKATVNQIFTKHEAMMARLKQKQVEALQKFKKETLETLSNLAVELKLNILLHTQVMVGLSDARRVDFNPLYEVDMNKLCFDVRLPLGATWDEFASKWKNLKDFYPNEGSAKLNIVPTDNNNNTIVVPAKNIKVVERGEREDDITSDLERGENIP